jgi:hypothetical protein
MRPETIIVNRWLYDGEYKKYRSTQEQIDRNERDKSIQRERDERARTEANSGSSNNSAQGQGSQAR